MAFVLSVTENGRPIQDAHRLDRLQKILFRMVNSDGRGVVHAKLVSVSGSLKFLRRQWSSGS